ncbi:kinase-like protein [Marasmius fiardii PR-910]|nr:kinase-like protein [Marasmius fiardii PR-910]
MATLSPHSSPRSLFPAFSSSTPQESNENEPHSSGLNLLFARRPPSPNPEQGHDHRLSRSLSGRRVKARPLLHDHESTPVNVSPATSRESSLDRRSDSTPSWIEKKFSPRPWNVTPRKKVPVPHEQTEAYLRTKARVDLAIDAVSLAAHTALEVAGELGDILPGLGIAARLLTNIWDAVEGVDSNRLACLRLTERCAEILLAVHDELREDDVGRGVRHEFERPIKILQESFTQFHDFLEKQNSQPFWKRYLRRDEILEEIETCDQALSDALFLFNMRTQVRLMKNIKSLACSHGGLFTSDTEPQEPALSDMDDLEIDELKNIPTTPVSPSPSTTVDDLAVEEVHHIRNFLRTLQERQNELDRASDLYDIKQLLSTALYAKSNREMIHVLQMGKHDMLHAIKYFLEIWDSRVNSLHPDSKLPSPKGHLKHRSLTWPLDEKENNLLDGGHLDSDILHGPVDINIPSWTISKSQVSCQEFIARGFFSQVYKGTWRHRMVAIKIVEASTPHHEFVNELQVWKDLTHPNILRLFGTSNPDGPESQRFFVSPYMRNGNLPQYLKRLEWEFGGIKLHESSLPRISFDLMRFMLEIARGMEYLHDRDVIHGDLKGANVLIDNDLKCVLADFGHSKFTQQITHSDPKHNHGLRWQSPEFMAGKSLLSRENDVYAYAVTSAEVMTMGSLPWPTLADDVVKELVLGQDERPLYPPALGRLLGIEYIIHRCWIKAPMARPSFSRVVRDLETAIRDTKSKVNGHPIL